MPDIGFGEILVIVVLALLVFGPDRLPKVAADAARTLRQARRMAAAARKDLVDASGIHEDEEFAQTVRDLRDLDPRNVMKEPPPNRRAPGRPRSTGSTGPGAPGSSTRPGAGKPAAGSVAGAAADQAGSRGPAGGPVGAAEGETGTPSGSPRTPPAATPGAAAADPDWT